jgi:hypothetical protein
MLDVPVVCRRLVTVGISGELGWRAAGEQLSWWMLAVGGGGAAPSLPSDACG